MPYIKIDKTIGFSPYKHIAQAVKSDYFRCQRPRNPFCLFLRKQTLSLEEEAIRNVRRRVEIPYINLERIPPTSNEVERLFSKAGQIFTIRRQAMNPMTLETLLLLQYNRHVWDSKTVAIAIESVSKRPRTQPTVPVVEQLQ